MSANNFQVKLLWARICNIFIEADNLEQVQLDTIEPLLCSAFESRHRHIVNTVSVMWNRAFEQAEEIQYPEKLKVALLSLRPYVDIVLPGLDVSSLDFTGQQPAFIDSQDEMDVSGPVLKPLLKTTPQSEKRSTSRRSRSNTPGSVNLSIPSQRQLEATPKASRRRSARRSATPRVRHNDSQIQFTTIASSSPSHNIDESQVLTERQKEIRERQQDNAAMFPEIRSSVERNKSPEKTGSPNISMQEKVATPKSHRSFEDYVSSTPTPRRGHASLIDDNDNEMTDEFPSSPPDPRRYPLIPEISKPPSSSSSMLDHWDFKSSPISGSPRPYRSIVADEQSASAAIQTQDLLAGESVLAHDQSASVLSEDEGDQADNEDEDRDMAMGEAETVPPPVFKRPITPPLTRSQTAQGTPKSDGEVFVDALTSPVSRTPRAQRALARATQSGLANEAKASQPKDYSFDVSDVDDSSLCRLVVELDSRKCGPLLSNTPAENAEQSQQAGVILERSGSSVVDCITVNTRSGKSSKRQRKSKDESSPSPVGTLASAEVNSSQETGKRSRNKRKRTVEKSQESSGKKRRHSQDLDLDAEAVPDSQLLQVNDSKPSTPFTMPETTSDSQPSRFIGAFGNFWRRTTDKLLARIFQSGSE